MAKVRQISSMVNSAVNNAIGQSDISPIYTGNFVGIFAAGGIDPPEPPPEPPEIVTFADGTDEQLAAMINAYYYGVITWDDMGWNVGDTRVIHLNSMGIPQGTNTEWQEQDITINILAHDNNTLAEPINEIEKACITVGTRELINNNVGMYVTGTGQLESAFIPWKDLYLREFLNTNILNAIPSTMQNIIKETSHYKHVAHNTAVSEIVIDKVFLPSFPETGLNSAAYWYAAADPSEGTLFPYYENTEYRRKKGNNNGSPIGNNLIWATSSPSSDGFNDGGNTHWGIYNDDGNARAIAANVLVNLAPCWCM